MKEIRQRFRRNIKYILHYKSKNGESNVIEDNLDKNIRNYFHNFSKKECIQVIKKGSKN